MTVIVSGGKSLELAKRTEGGPIEGTLISLYNSIIPNWWAENITGTFPVGDAALADTVWVANRCQQLNSQQIAGMKLEFNGTDEPAWVSSPDPHLFPNGIGDVVYTIVDQMYRYGYSCQYITERYATGLPRNFTILPSSGVDIRMVNGSRQYKAGDTILDASSIVQIDRNPGVGAHGSSALRAYAQTAWGLLAAQNQSMSVSQGGIPQAVLKAAKKITATQAAEIQAAWMTATSNRNGAPAVLGEDLTFEALSFNPSDLALLETQEWNSRVLATAYGVPAVILNMSLQGGLTYQNPMALMQMWWLTELRTTAKRIGDAFTAQMLPRGQWVSFDASDITTETINAADDEQAADVHVSQVAKASPAQQPRPLTAIGGGGG